MKKLDQLTRNELLEFININVPSVPLNVECCECVCCGSTPDAPFHYVCDECIELGDEHDAEAGARHGFLDPDKHLEKIAKKCSECGQKIG